MLENARRNPTTIRMFVILMNGFLEAFGVVVSSATLQFRLDACSLYWSPIR